MTFLRSARLIRSTYIETVNGAVSASLLGMATLPRLVDEETDTAIILIAVDADTTIPARDSGVTYDAASYWVARWKAAHFIDAITSELEE